MAEAIICDACGVTCKPKEAMHVRMHRLSSATNYQTATVKYYDICNTCYDNVTKFLGGKADVISGHHETTD